MADKGAKVEKKTPDPERRASRPAAAGALFPGVPIEVIDAYAQALLELAEHVPLPLLSGEERRAFQPGGEPTRDVTDSAGALRFAPQVTRRTGVSADQLEDALLRRELLVQLRDVALRLALGADEGLASLEEAPPERGAAELLERARRGEEVDAVLLSQALAARREGLHL